MVESITTKLLLNARRSYQTIQDIGQTKWCSNTPMLRIGHLTHGYQFWRKVEDRSKGFNIAWTRTILRNSYTLEQHKHIQEVQSILHYKTMYCYQKVLPSIFITSETEKNWGQWWITGLIPGGVSLKTGRHAVFFTVVNPMDNQDGLGETLCDLSKARIAPYKKYLETLSGCSILVQFEARSTKRTAILSNKIRRSYSLRHTAYKVHWESDMHEDQGSAL